MLFNDALIRRSQRALVPRVCMYTYVYVHTRVRIKKYMKKRSEVGGQSKVECFDVFPYSSVARCCSVSTYSCRESRPSRYVLWRKLPTRIYLPLRDRGKGNRSLTNTPRSINLDLLIFPGDIYLLLGSHGTISLNATRATTFLLSLDRVRGRRAIVVVELGLWKVGRRGKKEGEEQVCRRLAGLVGCQATRTYNR